MKRRDSVNKKLLYVGAICSLVSLFTACEALGPEPEPEPVTGSYEKAWVRVQIGNGVPGRTVMPDIALIDKWELWGGKGDNTDLLLTFDVVADAIIALEPGKWHFTIEGYKDSEHILSGTIAEQTIRLEETQTLAFEVESVVSGTGTISITINLPNESGITEARVFKDRIEHGSPITPVGDTIVFTETSDTGEYYYSFKLYNEDDELLGVVSEMVHVWADLTSAKTYTLLQKDLNLTYTISYLVYNKTTQAWEEFIYNETTQALEKFMPDGYYQIAATTTLATPSSRDDYYFKGWYELPEDAAEAAVSGSAVTKIPLGNTGNKTFYAKWIPKTLSGYSLEDALAMISANPEDGDDYTIVLNNDELVAIAPTELSYGGKTVSITLEGGAKERILSLSEPGSLFTLGDGVTLSLGSNITLQGRSDNTASLVTVDSGAELVINPGSKIRDNSSTTNGGGVSVGSGGEVTMNGGEISGNKALNSSGRGGGVYIDGGKFTLNEGAISGNSTPNSGTGASSGGGGVFVTNSGTFEMTGGEVSKNSSRTDGGGVFIKYGTFKMSGGVISGNSAQYGGAMYLSGGTITKASGGVIYGSDAESTLRNTGNGSVAYGRRNSTVEEGETLDSTKSGAEGGWVDRWTVTFNADGGVLVTQTVRVDTSTSLGASMPSDPTRDGYAFGGWYTAQNGGGTQFTETTPVTKHVTVYAFWLASASAQIDLRPVPDDPALSATTLLVSEEAAFSAEAGYASYQWYWDGIAISGATSPSYTLAANAELPGVYELSVVVATAAAPDEKLSARCQVTITAG